MSVDIDRIRDRAFHVLTNRNIYLASTARVTPAVELLVEAVPQLIEELERLKRRSKAS